jgi:hypothetical protein
MRDGRRVLTGSIAENLCEELNLLGEMLGGTVAMVVIQAQDGKLEFLSHPQVASDVFRAMTRVDWDNAAELADSQD